MAPYYGNSELLYDNDPNQVRAEMFRTIFGKYATHAAEYTKLLVKNIHDILKLFECHGYKHHHIRDAGYSEGHEKHTIYLTNKEKKSMICAIIQKKDVEKVKMAGEYWDDNDEHEYDGRRFNFVAIQTSSTGEYNWFKKLILESRLVEETKNKLYMMKNTDFGGVELDSFPMENVVCDIQLNYGSNFVHVYDNVINNLKDKKSGLYIFHGPPGTGKTTFIKYLTTVVTNRKFILVPNTLVGSIFSPKMVSNIYTFKDSVLVLEDAELCVFKRDGNNNELVSGILNITDGLLKDLLNISIFVTFNSSRVEELDKALLRKGRLKTMYKFDALSTSDSQKLLDHLGKNHTAKTPMTLADIYNIDDVVDLGGEVVNVSTGGIGFGAR